jgi:hypothetical protein
MPFDISKLMSKLPKFVQKFKDSTTIADGKVDWQDLLFVLDLAQLAFEEGLLQAARGRSANQLGLDITDHGSMMAYLGTIPDTYGAGETKTDQTQTDQGIVINPQDGGGQPGQNPREFVEWIPVATFVLTNLLPKLIAALKKKKTK